MRCMKQLMLAGVIGLACALPAFPVAQTKDPNCVTIGRPNPKKTYVMNHAESTGALTTVSQVWERVDETGSRLKWTGPKGSWLQINEHRIVDDVAVLDRTSKLGLNEVMIEATSFSKPGLVSDPAFRACSGRTWQIPAVLASFQSSSVKVSSQTPYGTLRIIAIRERVTVPAGTFDAVHYTRTSQSVDEYWKSLEHGVVVKHLAKVAGNSVTETLIAIK